MANNSNSSSTPGRKKRKASEATTTAASSSKDDESSSSQATQMSKAEKRAEALRRAQEYRDRLKAKKAGGGGGGGDASGAGSSPSPKKKKAAAGTKGSTKGSASKSKAKAKRSPARKPKSTSTSASAAASAASASATPTRATRSRVAQTPDTVPKPLPSSAGRSKGGGKGKRGTSTARASRGRTAEDTSSEEEEEEEEEEEDNMDVEQEEDTDEEMEDEDEKKKAAKDEEASFSSDDERTAQARNHGTPRKRRKVGRSPPKKGKARGDGGDDDGDGDGGGGAQESAPASAGTTDSRNKGGETAAERRARKAEEERRAREWRERKYHSPPSNTTASAGAGSGAGATKGAARNNISAARAAAAASPPRAQQLQQRPAPSLRRRPVVQNGRGGAHAAPAPAPEPVRVQQQQQQLEQPPEEEVETVDIGENAGKDQNVLGKYPYLMTLLLVCAPLGIGMFIGSSGLARPTLKDFTDELGGMLAETKRNLLPGQQANSQLFRCLADSPDVPAVENTSADEESEGGDATTANSGVDDSSWWTKTPPALSSKSTTTTKTCAGSANPLPCPRHGRCAHGFLVDCRADDAIAGRSDLFVVSDKSFTECVLSPEAKQMVSAIQGKVVDLSIEQKCNVSCRWGVGVPFISSNMTPKERCGGIDPDDVMAVRSKDDTVDYFFSVDGLVGAMNDDVTSATDSPAATGVSAITSEIVQLLAPHLDEGIIKYIPGSSAILTPRIGLAIDFVSNKLDEYLPFSCWFPTKVRECLLFLLGLVVVVSSWIFRFIRNNPGYAFYIFLTSVAAQHLYLWVERRLITREAKIVVELVRNELAAHPEGAAVRQLHIRDDIGQTHHLYAGTTFRAGLRRKWMYQKVWKRVKDEIERDRRFRSEKRRTERGKYMEVWVVEFKSRRG